MKTRPALSEMLITRMRWGSFTSLVLVLCLFVMPIAYVHAAEHFDSDLHDYRAPPQLPTVGNQADPEAWVLDLSSDLERAAAA